MIPTSSSIGIASLPPECFVHIGTFLSVREVLGFASTSHLSLELTLPILYHIQWTLFFDEPIVIATANCCQGRKDSRWTQGERRTRTVSERTIITQPAEDSPSNRPYPIVTLEQRIQILADRIPSKYSNRAKIQALREALAVTKQAHRRRTTTTTTRNSHYVLDSSAFSSSSSSGIQKLHSLILPLRLLHQITLIQDGPTTGGRCLLDEYMGDVYCVLYLSLSFSQQLHRIINGLALSSSQALLPKACARSNPIQVDGSVSSHNDMTMMRYCDWVYWHARWLTKPGILSDEQCDRYGVFTELVTLPQPRLSPPIRRHHRSSSSSMMTSLQHTTVVVTEPSSSAASCHLTLVYDDFAPLMLGPQFRGRDIVRMVDVSAASMIRFNEENAASMIRFNEENDTNTTVSSSSSSSVRHWILCAHEQTISYRPMTVRPPEIRFG